MTIDSNDDVFKKQQAKYNKEIDALQDKFDKEALNNARKTLNYSALKTINYITDLIYFDLANTDYPIAFNPLDGTENDDERDVVTNDLVEMFVSMYGEEIFGPRIQDYFRNACFLLMEQPE